MRCKVCNETNQELFYLRCVSYCKEHWKARVRQNRIKNADYYRAYDRARGNRQPSWYLREYRNKNTRKYKAHNAVNNAIRDGKLQRKDACESCGSKSNLHAHHDDYSRPLDVRWLCSACHRQWHIENGEAA